MILTKAAKKLIQTLENNGYEAYAVGGAVRDFLRGVKYSDIDFTTSATPEQMMEVFSNFKVYPTGIKYGTLTVKVDDECFEITTYRSEKGYSDNRRPDEVEFISNLNEDLKRRDYTINAIAYNPSSGYIDIFNGQADIKNKILKTVGNPTERFKEDALRILRGLRFASSLGFTIEEETKKAILENFNLLQNVAVERIKVELDGILCGAYVGEVLREFKNVFFFLIPKLKDCDGFLQFSKYHNLDVYNHIVKSVETSSNDKIVRWALLLHDIEKPSCFTKDDLNIGHFYGHQKKSSETAREILRGFKCDNFTVNTVSQLIYLHDIHIEETPASVKLFLSKYGFSFLKQFVEVRKGDGYAHTKPYDLERVEHAERLLKMAESIVKSGECYSLKRLAVNGDDIKKLGYKGAEIKQVLEFVLSGVIKGEIENNKNEILSRLSNDERVR